MCIRNSPLRARMLRRPQRCIWTFGWRSGRSVLRFHGPGMWVLGAPRQCSQTWFPVPGPVFSPPAGAVAPPRPLFHHRTSAQRQPFPIWTAGDLAFWTSSLDPGRWCRSPAIHCWCSTTTRPIATNSPATESMPRAPSSSLASPAAARPLLRQPHPQPPDPPAPGSPHHAAGRWHRRG